MFINNGKTWSEQPESILNSRSPRRENSNILAEWSRISKSGMQHTCYKRLKDLIGLSKLTAVNRQSMRNPSTSLSKGPCCPSANWLVSNKSHEELKTVKFRMGKVLKRDFTEKK
ncbi:hypothetical protein Ccrd_026222 [Cynara cardunculus var. scolymus]|uniref:Uncharacterized protein n=1 Tax=Cynara cardunculus var. scolymus TaxID=59895 RepID=A0A118JSG7_CYNCS|nr:hypothetical protein Ccrd_026222 [Cynara cardunculus var. scolymus]